MYKYEYEKSRTSGDQENFGNDLFQYLRWGQMYKTNFPANLTVAGGVDEHLGSEDVEKHNSDAAAMTPSHIIKSVMPSNYYVKLSCKTPQMSA